MLTLKLEGKELELEDAYWNSCAGIMPKVRAPFLVFIEQIINSSTKFTQLITELEHEIAFRRNHGVSEEVESKLTEITRSIQIDY